MTQGELIAILSSGAVVAVISSVIGAYINRRKISAEIETMRVTADASSSDAWRELLKPYQDEVQKLREQNMSLQAQINQVSDAFTIKLQRLERENVELKRENVELGERVKRLEAQVISLGKVPVTRTQE